VHKADIQGSTYSECDWRGWPVRRRRRIQRVHRERVPSCRIQWCSSWSPGRSASRVTAGSVRPSRRSLAVETRSRRTRSSPCHRTSAELSSPATTTFQQSHYTMTQKHPATWDALFLSPYVTININDDKNWEGCQFWSKMVPHTS